MSYRNVDVHEHYDLKTDSWSRRAPLPQATSGIAAAAMGGKLYVSGGEDDKEPYEVHDSVWAYDPNTDTWSEITSISVPLHGHGAVALQDGIHIVGGSEKPGGTGTTARHHVFATESNSVE